MKADLISWNDTPAKQAIQDFVSKVTDVAHPAYVPPAERVAVFDNDGTLWCEKPIQPQVDFILRRLAEMADENMSLRSQQPWQAAYENDKAWFDDAMVKHYHGDESKVKVLLGGILKAFEAMTVEAFQELAGDFMRRTEHPVLGIPYADVTFQPMVELLRYLDEQDFTSYIVSGGGRDFMRPMTETLYGIPPERVIGSAVELEFRTSDQGAQLFRRPGLDVIDDGPAKVVQIWERIGRSPILAAGNANGDIPMLQYTESGVRTSLCLLVDHDDSVREFAYTAGAESSVQMAREREWTVVSVKRDWSNVFAS